MSGYRQHSFDPNAYEQPGPPLRPYNWVQWMGVAIGGVGVALYAVYLLGKIGVLPQWIDGLTPIGFIFPLIGVSLINSRRQPSHDPAPELAAARKRWLIIIVGLSAAIIGAAVAIEFTGA